MTSKAAQARADKAEALESLRDLCPPGTKIWTVLRGVSKSGLTRGIDCYVFAAYHDEPDTELTKLWLSRFMFRAGIAPWDNKRECLKVEGGMDMGFHLVHQLSYALHGMKDVDTRGKPVMGQDWPTEPTPTAYRAGYSLLHEWI